MQTLYYLIRGTVFDDFRAQVTTLDGTKVLLVALSVAGILVKHVRRSCLSLCLDYGIPQLLCLYLFSSPSFLFVTALKTYTFEIIYIWHVTIMTRMPISKFKPNAFFILNKAESPIYTNLSYNFSNSSPQTSASPGHSFGHISVQSLFSSTRFMKRSGIQRA